MNVLSIQSHVAYGHVGNTAATLPLQRLGHAVWAVPTLVWSNHAGYGDRGGPVLAPADVAAVIDGIARRGVLGDCAAVLSGYLGTPALGSVVRDAVARVRAANPAAIYVCDPVLGDRESGLYVDPGIAPLMARQLAPAADLVTPNVFELEQLGGHAAGALANAGPERVAVAARELLGTSA